MSELVELWEQLVERYPERTAAVGSDQRLSYRELDAQIEAATRHLRHLGVTAGSKVALFFANEPGFVVALFAVLKAGGVPCPLNVSLTLRELEQLLAVVEPDLALVSQLGAAEFAFLQQKVPIVRVQRGALEPSDIQLPARQPEAELDGVAVILCTSGTTGLPKAGMLTHHGLVENVRGIRAHLERWPDKSWQEPEVFANVIPLSHPYGFTILTLLPLSLGGTVVFLPRFSPESFLLAVEQEKITFFGGVPSMYAMLNKYHRNRRFDLSSLKLCISGGAPLIPPVGEDFQANYGLPIYEGYGMLETSPVITLNFDEPPHQRGSVGPLLEGLFEIAIRDDQGQPAAVGEVCLKGPCVMRGYYRNPTATAQALQDGFLLTGDIGRLDANGYLHLLGRKKELIIVGGHNVYPTEIEAVLMEDPALVDAAVATLEDPLRGEQVLAFVVTQPESSFDEKALLGRCRAVLSAYKVPRRIYPVAHIPRNAIGKILRKQLVADLAVSSL